MDKKKGFCVWFFGLSGAGKTTLGTKLYGTLKELEMEADMFDGDTVRKLLTPDLGFSLEDRFAHIRRVAFVVKALVEHGVNVVCCFITPLKAMRYFLQQYIPNILLIECRCDLRVCMERDPKGLYKKALNGEIKDFTGLTQTYEVGETETFWVLHTDSYNETQSFKDLLDMLIDFKVIAYDRD